jgi:hypothetical protein
LTRGKNKQEFKKKEAHLTDKQVEELNTSGVDKKEATEAKSKTESQDKDKWWLSPFMLLVFCIIVSLTISMAVLYLYDRYFAIKVDPQSIPKIVKADFDKFMAEQAKQYAAGKISQEQFIAAVDSYQKKIEAMPKNKVVFLLYKGDLFIKNAENFEP